jgi:cell division protein YceG involved in septum cleavage
MISLLTTSVIVLIVLVVGLYTLCRVFTFFKWFFFLKDYQKLANRLDEDIILLREGKLEQAVLREAKSDKMIAEFKRKYPKEL